jgi:phosphatidylglycerophosphatase A
MKDLSKKHELIITFFNCGKFKYGPGTLTSFLCLPIWIIISYFFYLADYTIITIHLFWFSLLSSLFLFGIYAIPLYSKNLDNKDDPSIVLDEVVGQLLTLLLSYLPVAKYYFKANFSQLLILQVICSFILFRVFDILKPSIIKTIDQNFKSGFGVMLDDVVAAVIAALITNIIVILFKFFL